MRRLAGFVDRTTQFKPHWLIGVPLQGFGQVVFADSAFSGFFILIGLLVGHPWLGFLSIIGCYAGTIAAWVANVSGDQVEHGLLGYNGVLVGCGFAVFLGFEEWSWECIVATALGGVAQTFMFVALANMYKTPCWTFPFNFVLLMSLLYVRPFISVEELLLPASISRVEYFASYGIVELITAILHGVSQIFVVKSWITGLLILFGLSAYTWRLGLACALGSLMGLLTALAMQEDVAAVKAGIGGYNAALAACAVVTFVEPTKEMWVLVISSAVAAQWVAAGLGRASADVFHMPIGTLPFCIVASLSHQMIQRIKGISSPGEPAFTTSTFEDDLEKVVIGGTTLDRAISDATTEPHSIDTAASSDKTDSITIAL
eukprot:TRINITY_DN5561_c0_g3_i1.p1 TRINITY_DN5561_c0_g3~~TRINITY_DN5561_c0_g3_i1.p1  ORF type:complete len:373 (-),score=43.00 TRINITY_DN5561_c0_g3_i1:324-1442(-)